MKRCLQCCWSNQSLMDFQRNELMRLLTEKGWEVEVADNYESRSWTKEVWRICSVWSCVGTVAYVAFVLDPMEIRPKKAFVWAISIYFELPLYGVNNVFTMSLNQWKTELPEFLKTLEKLRDPDIVNVTNA